MVPNSQSIIAATFLQTTLYGLYVATCVHSLRWLVFNDEGWILRARMEFHWPILLATVLFFALSTTDLVATIRIILGIGNGIRPEAKLFVTTDAMEGITLLIADAVLVYRCWVVYFKSWRIVVIPVALWIANLGLVTFIISIEAVAMSEPRRLPEIRRQSFFYGAWIAFYFGNIVINVYATSAVILKLIRVAHESGSTYSAGRLYNTSRILAESGILYTLTTVLNLISTVLNLICKSHLILLQSISDAVNFSMAGIAFNLIVIRVGRMRADEAARPVVDVDRTPRTETRPRLLLISPSPHQETARKREAWVHYHPVKRLDKWAPA